MFAPGRVSFLGIALDSDSSEDEDYVPSDAEGEDEEDELEGLEPDPLLDFDEDVIYAQFREALASGEPLFGLDDDENEEDYHPAPGRGKQGTGQYRISKRERKYFESEAARDVEVPSDSDSEGSVEEDKGDHANFLTAAQAQCLQAQLEGLVQLLLQAMVTVAVARCNKKFESTLSVHTASTLVTKLLVMLRSFVCHHPVLGASLPSEDPQPPCSGSYADGSPGDLLPPYAPLLPLAFHSETPSFFNPGLLSTVDRVVRWVYVCMNAGAPPPAKQDDIVVAVRHRFLPALIPPGWPHVKTVYPASARVAFSPSEDQLLFLGLCKYGPRDWPALQKDLLPAREIVKLSTRLKNAGSLSKDGGLLAAYRVLAQLELFDWSVEEAALVKYGVAIHGRRWKQIAACLLPHRGPSDVAKFYSAALGERPGDEGTIPAAVRAVFPSFQLQLGTAFSPPMSDDELLAHYWPEAEGPGAGDATHTHSHTHAPQGARIRSHGSSPQLPADARTHSHTQPGDTRTQPPLQQLLWAADASRLSFGGTLLPSGLTMDAPGAFPGDVSRFAWLEGGEGTQAPSLLLSGAHTGVTNFVTQFTGFDEASQLPDPSPPTQPRASLTPLDAPLHSSDSLDGLSAIAAAVPALPLASPPPPTPPVSLFSLAVTASATPRAVAETVCAPPVAKKQKASGKKWRREDDKEILLAVAQQQDTPATWDGLAVKLECSAEEVQQRYATLLSYRNQKKS